MTQPIPRPGSIPVPIEPDNLTPEERAEVGQRIQEVAAEAAERVDCICLSPRTQPPADK